MIYHNNNLFIHITKTGGSSIRRYIEQCGKMPPNPFAVPPFMHYTLQDIYDRRNSLKIDFDNIEKIIIMIRNPYDRIFSLYHFYKQTLVNQGLRRELPNIYNYIHLEFNQWLIQLEKEDAYYHWYDYDRYITINGKIPENLKIFKFERFNTALRSIVKLFGLEFKENLEVPHIFKTKHPKFARVYDRNSYDIINRMLPWAFDKGSYQQK